MTSAAKAKMYKTARIIAEAWDIPEGFSAGDFVSVTFLHKCMGACVFQCSRGSSIAAISEFELERFAL